jgi:hypothetical protein
VKLFDPNGGVASTERIVTEEQKVANGSIAHSTTYRTDVNGQMHESERRTIETHTQGPSATTQSEIARPDINGSFATAEKRSLVSETGNDGTHTDETIYRASPNGGFYTAARDVSETTKNGSQVVQKSAHYEPGDNQQLQLTAQTVSTTVKRPDGSTVAEVNRYSTHPEDGRAYDTQSGLHLLEQQTVEQIPGPGGSVTEVVTARRPTATDPNRLGEPRKISEMVCTGKCSNVGFMH